MRLLEIASEHADRTALSVGGATYSYSALMGEARQLAALLREARGPVLPDELVAVMGSRTKNSFVGILGTLFSGAAYVPLHPKFPIERTEHMLRASKTRTLIVETAELVTVEAILGSLRPLIIVVSDAESVDEYAARHPSHRWFGRADIGARDPLGAAPATSDSLAYVMFTSGSTGTPKGVMLTHGNVLACMASFGDRYDITFEDRFSQNFDLTFDLSVFDMFLCWLHGASLHVPAPAQRACPASLVTSSELTVWFSVPSMALFMEKMRALKRDAFSSLRCSLFCGERLPVSTAEAWRVAAPNGVLENLYGPTEVTIACTAHTFRPSEVTPAMKGNVPIGLPLPTLGAAIVDASLALVDDGEVGELCICGPQVARGYLAQPGATCERFVVMPWDPRQERWYRTGDLASHLEGGPLVHLGRTDDQVKIRGYRVELGEVEFALRRLLGTEAASVIAAPAPGADGTELVAYVALPSVDEDTVREELTRRLPSYMALARILLVNDLPLNSNGKVDKPALRRMYLESHGNPQRD